MRKIKQLLRDYLPRVVSRKDGSVRAIWKLILWMELLVVLMVLWAKFPWHTDLWGLEYALMVLLPSLFLFRVVEGRRFLQSFGLAMSRGWLRELWLGILLGAAAMTVGFLCLLLTGNANAEWNVKSIGVFWISGLILGFVPWATQELIFRGYPLIVLVSAVGKPAALLLTSIPFALYHGGGWPLGWLNITLLGVTMGILFLRTGRLWAAIGLHYGWNLFQYLVFNIPGYVPILSQSVFRTTLTGSTLFIGGDFGVEASIFSTALGIVLVVLALKISWFAIDTGISSPFSTPIRPLPVLGNAAVFACVIAGIAWYVGIYLPGTRPLFKEHPDISSFTLYERQEPASSAVFVESIGLSLTNADTGSLSVTLHNESDSEQRVIVAITHSWRGWFKRAMGTKEASDTLGSASRKEIVFPVGLRSARANTAIKVTVYLCREPKITGEPDSLLFQKSFRLRDFVR